MTIGKNIELSVINQVSAQRLRQVKENRSRLRTIVETLIFLERQNIPLRGHRDDGRLDLYSVVNEGNFREMLRYRINCGDIELKKHLEESSSRATHISKTIQNEIIECCGEVILSHIIKHVKNAGVYSLMFDKTTDVSCISQMSLIIRYTDGKHIFESFV